MTAPKSRLIWMMVVAAVIGASYLLTASLGFAQEALAWAFWPCNGILMAIFLMRPRREWVWYSVGYLLGKHAAYIILHQKLWDLSQLILGGCNVAHALLGALLLQVVLNKKRPSFASLIDVVAFCLLGVVFAPLLPALLASLINSLLQAKPLFHQWEVLYVGDSLGTLLFVPLMLTWWPTKQPVPRLPQDNGFQRYLWPLSVALLTLGVFCVHGLGPLTLPLPYALIPGIALLAMWISPRLLQLSIFSSAVIAIVCTALGSGPFAISDLTANQNIMLLRGYVALTVVSGMLLCALLHHRLLTEQQQMQDEKLKALGLMASRIAHDFRNDIAVFVGIGDLLKDTRGSALTEEEKTYFALFDESIERSQKLIDDLLTYSRVKPRKEEQINLPEFLREFTPTLQRLVGKGVEIKQAHPSYHETITFDPHELQVILLNLANNAREAMDGKGTLTFQTEIKAARRQRWLRLYVKDTGHGIPEGIIHQVFEPFFSTKTGQSGTGLGLATVRQIINSMDGQISIKLCDKGACFVLDFPLPSPPQTGAPQALHHNGTS